MGAAGGRLFAALGMTVRASGGPRFLLSEQPLSPLDQRLRALDAEPAQRPERASALLVVGHEEVLDLVEQVPGHVLDRPDVAVGAGGPRPLRSGGRCAGSCRPASASPRGRRRSARASRHPGKVGFSIRTRTSTGSPSSAAVEGIDPKSKGNTAPGGRTCAIVNMFFFASSLNFVALPFGVSTMTWSRPDSESHAGRDLVTMIPDDADLVPAGGGSTRASLYGSIGPGPNRSMSPSPTTSGSRSPVRRQENRPGIAEPRRARRAAVRGPAPIESHETRDGERDGQDEAGGFRPGNRRFRPEDHPGAERQDEIRRGQQQLCRPELRPLEPALPPGKNWPIAKPASAPPTL